MSKKYTLLSFFILIAFLLIGATPATSEAQFAARVNNYTLNPSFAGNSNTIVNAPGTNVIQYLNYPYGYYYTPGYTNYSTFSLPFAVNFDSVNYPAGSTMYAYWSGSIGFANANPNYNYNYGAEGGSSSLPNRIMGWDMLYHGFYGYFYDNDYNGNYNYYSGIYYQVTGAVGSRVATIEYHGFSMYYGEYGYALNMQFKIYELNNNIEIYFLPTNSFQYYGYDGSTALDGNTSPTFVSNIAHNSNGDYYFYYGDGPSQNYQFICPHVKYNVQLSAQPKLITFNNTLIGNVQQANVTIKNTGTEPTVPLAITSTSMAGNPDFTVVSTPGSLAPGASANLVVQFNPQLIGSRSAVLTIVSNGRDSGTQTVTLNGVGLAPLIAIDTNIAFKKMLTKMGSFAQKRILIFNTGGGGLVINSLVFSGSDANQYSLIHSPAGVIAPGGTDSLIVKYTPTIEGRHVATLTINSNAYNAPSLPIQLIGTGILPHIVITPIPMVFDSTFEGDTASQQFTISNPGSDTLLISPNFLSSNDGDFKITALTGSDTLIPPDHSKTVGVTFRPLQQGTRQASYFLRTNIPKTFEVVPRDTASSILISIRGTGVPFGVLAQSLGGATYDTVITGTEVCRTDTLRNNGDADLTINSWAITGANASIFTASGLTTPYLLKARSSIVVNLCATPTTNGLNTGTLTISGKSSGKSEAINLALNVYGLKVCDQSDPASLFGASAAAPELVLENTDSSECVTVTNCGEVAAIYTAKLSANGSPDYTLSSTSPSLSVPAGGTTTFCVKFHPNTSASETSSLVISTSDLADMTIPINGSGACAAMTTTAATYPENPGTEGHYSITIPITNTGNYPWTPGAGTITQTGGNGTAFSNVVVNPNPIPAGGNGTITVNFDPDQEPSILYTGSITFPGATPPCAQLSGIGLSVQMTTAGVPQVVAQNGFALGQNYPNPVTSTTNFTYSTPEESQIVLRMNDMTGKLIRTIASGYVSGGDHTVTLDASTLASGTYIVTLQSGNVSLTRQLVVTK